MYVKMLKTSTEIREIILSPFSLRSVAKNLLIKSPTTRVALPTRRAEAVETSAAQSPASTSPATIGLKLRTVRGRASAVEVISKGSTVAAIPMIALMKPTGKMIKPPRMNPFRAEEESFAAKEI